MRGRVGEYSLCRSWKARRGSTSSDTVAFVGGINDTAAIDERVSESSFDTDIENWYWLILTKNGFVYSIEFFVHRVSTVVKICS